MVCDVDVEIVQTQWNRCWSDDRIGPGLASGEYHGCATYTHASGVRNRYLGKSVQALLLGLTWSIPLGFCPLRMRRNKDLTRFDNLFIPQNSRMPF